MTDPSQKVDADRQLILDAKSRGTGATLGAFVKLSGPGWLQGAITLGGGSLAGSLYLGVLGGYNLLWLQLVAMVLGIVMLSAISYVTLSTGERPFQAINRHINPVLGWGWALATLMANLVWCLPQFSLGTAAVQQNLLGSGEGSKIWIALSFLIIAVVVIWFYDSGGKGIKIFEAFLKIVVGVIVVCFFGVVIKMAFSEESLPWGEIFAGFVPDLDMIWNPASTFDEALAATGQYTEYWSGKIVSMQRDVMITAAATAVGINMTFLLPYSMLRKGWNKDFRGLAVFDLSTGLFIPFVLATSCVVIASAAQFHTKYDAGLVGEPGADAPAANLVAGYVGNCNARVTVDLKKDAAKYDELVDEQEKHDEDKQQKRRELSEEAFEQAAKSDPALGPGPLDKALAEGRERLSLADRRLAAMLVKRDAFNLAKSLSRLTGPATANYVFGIGVIGMALSTIIILMLINGFVVCEILGQPQGGWAHRIGCLMPAAVGFTGPFFWKDAAFWLAVPTSVFGMTLLPVAYITFFFMMNRRPLMGEHLPRGGRRVVWNTLMAIAGIAAMFGSGWAIWSKAGWWGVGGVALFIALVVIAHFARLHPSATSESDAEL